MATIIVTAENRELARKQAMPEWAVCEKSWQEYETAVRAHGFLVDSRYYPEDDDLVEEQQAADELAAELASLSDTPRTLASRARVRAVQQNIAHLRELLAVYEADAAAFDAAWNTHTADTGV